MFGFTHPRPPSRKEVAMQIVQQERWSVDTHSLQVDPPDGPVAAPPDDLPVNFSVAYTLGEYLAILREHMAFVMRQKRPGKRQSKWLWPAMLAVVATPIFYWKKRRMPVCDFRIDAAGIERTTRGGTLARRWDQVQSVRRYRLGYVVMFEKSGMPLPFRCMTAGQQERLRALIATHTQ